MDFTKLDTTRATEAGVDMELRHPTTGEPLGLTLRIVGYDSERILEVRRRQSDDLAKEGRRRISAKKYEANLKAQLAATVIGWEARETVSSEGAKIDAATIGDEPWPPFSSETLAKILKRFPWMADQIDTFAGDRANFLPS